MKAGSRRLRALQRLIEQGTLPADHSVPFLVIGDDNNPIEVSLTENFQRVPMNPADECTGFNLLIQMGMTAEAQTLGGQVREGERSQIAIFYKSSSKTAESPVTGDSSDEMRRVLRSYAVFNCDQIDGLSPDFYPSPVNVVPVYWDIVIGDIVLSKVGWSYPKPTPAFAALRDHVAFYAAAFDCCSVDDQVVTPQPGGFHERGRRPVQRRTGKSGLVMDERDGLATLSVPHSRLSRFAVRRNWHRRRR